MKRMLTVLAFGWSALALSGVVLAAEPERTGPPGPEMMFQRMDRNSDGRVTLDEVPDGAPDFVKELLKRADKDGDGVVTLEEFRAAMPQMGPRAGGPPTGRGFGPPSGPPIGERGRSEAGRPAAERSPSGRSEAGRPEADRGPSGRPDAARRPSGRPEAGRPDAERRPTSRPESAGRAAPSRGSQPTRARRPETAGSPRGVGPSAPGTWGDPKAWFDRLDRDKDGKLSPEEFAAGMRMFHQAPMQRPQRPAVVPGAPQARSPWAAAPPTRRSRDASPSAGRAGPPRQPSGPAWARSPMPRGPQSVWGRGPAMQAPRHGSPWGRGPMMHGPQFGSPWGRGPMMQGRPDSGMRPSISPQHREEITKRIEQARMHAEAAWKKAMALRDRVRQELAQKPKAAEPQVKKDKSEVKKAEADVQAAATKKEAAGKKEAAKKEPTAKKDAAKKPAEKKPSEKPAPKKT